MSSSIKHAVLVATLACLALGALVVARQDAGAPQATFRGGVDLIQLDVAVLDKNRKPVRGLTAADFAVLEDGKTRPIRGFSAVDVPPRIVPTAPWMRDVPPDVVTNTPLTGRVLAIVIDDGSLAQGGGARGMQKMRAIAKAAIDELGPEDVAAVIYTLYNHSAQGFTKDRARLLQSVDDAALIPQMQDLTQSGMCMCGLCSVQALENVTKALISYPERRKTLLYISTGVSILPEYTEYNAPTLAPVGCMPRRTDHVIKALRNAAIANVSIQAIDPNGLCGSDCVSYPETLKTLAEHTGGRAVVQNNDAEATVPALFEESSAYYLLSVETAVTKDDGRFHPLKVVVNNRPDLEVSTRGGYYAPTVKERAAMTASRDVTAAGDTISGAVPKSDIPLEVAAMPFATADPKRPVIALVLSPRERSGANVGPPKAFATIDVVASAYGQETGKFYGSTKQTFKIPANASGELHYEVLSRLPMKPGRYEVRLGLKDDEGRSGSVYTYAEVPDFAKEALSLSGLALTAASSPIAAPPHEFSDLMPATPTARRTFVPGDRVVAFLRVYEGGSRPVVPAIITTRVVNTSNEEVARDTTHLGTEVFNTVRRADYRYAVPIDRLAPGEYLLEVTAAAGETTGRRALRFSVE